MEARTQCVEISFNWTFLDFEFALDYRHRPKFARQCPNVSTTPLNNGVFGNVYLLAGKYHEVNRWKLGHSVVK